MPPLPPLPPALMIATPGVPSDTVVTSPLFAAVMVREKLGPLTPSPPAVASMPIVKQPPNTQISTPPPALPSPPLAPRRTSLTWWMSPAAVGKVKVVVPEPLLPAELTGTPAIWEPTSSTVLTT